jgi:hypothetical protein
VYENILDAQNDKHIQCVFSTTPSQPKTKKKFANGSVVGHSKQKSAPVGLNTAQFITSVPIDKRMGASVAVVVLSKSYCQLANPSWIADTTRRR